MKYKVLQKIIIGFILFTAFCFSGEVIYAQEIEKTEFSVESFRRGTQHDSMADFVITLTKRVIVGKTLYTDLPDDAIQITPALQAKVRWIARNQIGIFLESALAPGVNYSFELSSKLNPSANYALVGLRKFTYPTPPFKVEKAEIGFQYDKELKKAKAIAAITFNYPVTIAGLEKHLSILSGRGDEIPYSFQEQSPTTRTVLIEIKDIPPLLEGRYLQVKIAEGFKCYGAEIGLKEPSVAPIQLQNIRELQTDRSDFQQRDGKLFINIRFSSQINLEMFQENISIEPEIPFQLAVNYRHLEIHADYQHRANYTVNIKNGIASEDGSILRDTFVKRLTVPDLYRGIRFTDNTFFLPRKGALKLDVATTNLERVGIGIAKVYLSSLPALIHQGELIIESKLNEEIITPLSLKDYLKDNHAGIFKVVVHADSGQSGYAEQLVVVTDLGIVVKRIDKDLYVWVNSLDSLDPIQKAKVQLINNRDKKALLSGNTDDAGFVKLTIESEMLKDNPEFLITAEKGDDFSLLQLQRYQMQTHSFNVGGVPYLVKGHEAYLYTDRGVYRPGETAHLIGIVRGQNSTTPKSLPVRIEIVNPQNATLKEYQEQTDDEGTCEVDIPLPAYTPTGWYTVKMWTGEKQIGSASFQVEEFIPDRMKVSVEADKDSYMLDDEVTIDVKAENLFGTPAVGRKVSGYYNLQQVRYRPPEAWDSFIFFDPNRSFSFDTVYFDQAVTDIDGIATYQFTLPEGLKPPSSLSGYVIATVQELGGRSVTASKGFTVHPYSHYVGIKRPEAGTVKRNEEVVFNYISLDTDGKATAGRTLKATIYAVENWHRWRRQNKPEVIELETFTLESEVEIADFSYTPVNYGVHRVDIEDVDSGAKTHIDFYVSEWGGVPWSLDNPDTLDMILDKAAYRPGEKAQLQIKPPFPGKVLLTIEREKVLSHQTITVKENTETLTIPVEDGYAPNVYLSAMLIRSTTSLDKDAPARAFGIIPLKIDAEAHRLKVELDVPEQIRPNREVDIKYRVSGERKGQSYRITIAAVDEGILQLTGTQTPDPHARFYQQRRLNTISSEFHNAITRDHRFPIKPIESLADLMKLVTTTPKRASRGQLIEQEALVAGILESSVSISVVEADSAVFSRMASPASLARLGTARQESLAAKRQSRLNTDSAVRVMSVSLWSGMMETDADGTGTVRFKIPQFNGSLRIMAVAYAGADFGSATEEIKVRDPVILTPTFPRFLTGGDQIRVPVSIYNGTDKTGEFSVKLQASGPIKLIMEDGSNNRTVLVQESSLQKQIQVASGKEGQVFFDVVAQDAVGIATFNLSASGNGEEIEFAPMRLPLRSAAPPVTKTGQGIVRENEPADFIFPSNIRPDTSEFMLTVSPLPTLRFAGGLRYLIQYPHGCLEQTTSRVFPLLYLSDLARIVEPMLAEEGKIDEYINAGITKLEDMLLPEHHFAYWQGRTQINNWSSIYASHFLVEARKAGYKVSDLVYYRMLEGLRRQARNGGSLNRPNQKADRYRLSQTVYACYVLAAAGAPEKSVMYYLKNNRLSELNDYSQFQLAGAFALSGNMGMAVSMLPEVVEIDKIDQRRDTGGNFDSPVRAQAIMLDVLMEVMDDHPAIIPLVESLTETASKRHRWTNTQDNAFAFLALGKYLKKQPNQKYTGTLTRDAAHMANFDSAGTQYIGSDWDGAEIKLTVKGKGTCYYFWEAFGIGRDSYIEEYGRELQVNRRYLTPDGSRVKNVFQQGELVIAEISVKALTSYLQNVVVVDMFPAGFEIENPRLATRYRSHWTSGNDYTPEYIDIRDDSLIFFGSFKKQVEQKFYYPLRVVTEGTFTVPPVSAEAMYDPTISAVASSGTVQVIK